MIFFATIFFRTINHLWYNIELTHVIRHYYLVGERSMPIEFENSPEYDLHSSIHVKPIVEEYQTEHEILTNDHSTIYLIRSRLNGQLFTLKAIRKMDGITYDFNEMIKLKHENIVTISAHYESEKFHYIIKPYLEGVDLHKYILEKGPLNRSQINLLIKQLVSAIKYLHDREQPLIFRDLKPSNIIVDEESSSTGFKITLIDVETMRQKNLNKRSDTYYVMSHGYTSPEQYGFRQTDVRSDIYSLGATLYFAITGNTPESQLNITKYCIENQLVIDRRLARVIERSLSFDPNNRYNSIFSFERALKRMDYSRVLASLLLVVCFSLTFIWFNSSRSHIETTDEQEYTVLETDETNSFFSQMHASADVTNTLQSNQAISDSSSQSVTESIDTSVNSNVTLYNDQKLIASHSGVYITKVNETEYSIWANRNELSHDKKDFVFMSVFSYADHHSETDFSDWNRGALDNGYGFQIYNESTGYRSINNHKHYVVFMYDLNKNLVGAMYFTNIR